MFEREERRITYFILYVIFLLNIFLIGKSKFFMKNCAYFFTFTTLRQLGIFNMGKASRDKRISTTEKQNKRVGVLEVPSSSFNLMKNSTYLKGVKHVVDLCVAPGSWSQLLDILMDALPSKVDTQAYQNQNMRQLNQKLLLLEQELREMKAEMLKGKRQNEEPSEDATGKKNSHGETQELSKGANGHSYGETQGEENGRGEHRVHGGGERRMHSQQNIWGDKNSEDGEDIWLHDANETGNGGSLENAKCKLLNWDGTKVVVAEGTIASTDSKALVHHVPLGPRCWKVWVNHVIVNAPLFRPNCEMFVLEDAIGSTVAWPTHLRTLLGQPMLDQGH
ncbi:unnamed protein product [Camellia sinensis]